MSTKEGVKVGTNVEAKKRIDYFDIAKGIGIILVVWAHAKGPFERQIFDFHMPFFFLISGLLYNTNSTVIEFIKKRVYSLYIPFAFWNLLIFLVNSFVYKPGVAASAWLGTKILLTLDKDGTYFGATWFLGALFVMSIFYKVSDTILDYIIGKTEMKQLIKNIILLAGFCAMMVVAFCINLPFMLSRTVILGFYYALGAFYKKYKDTLEIKTTYKIILTVGFVLFFVLTAKYNGANMGINKYKNPVLFVFAAFAMSYALLQFCIFLSSVKLSIVKRINKIFIALGQRSIDIVIWHFVFFRIIIVIQMIINNEAITYGNVLEHYPVYNAKNGWWVAYTLTGICISLLWCDFLRLKPWGKMLKKCHIV